MVEEGRRIDYLDGLRASLMLLGIPFHAALAFSGEPWLVTSPQTSLSLTIVAEFLHVWRLPAFFIVAGYFAALMVRRRGAIPWLNGRLRRLGIPLVAGMILFSPLQWLIIGAFDDAPGGAVSEALRRAWPPSAYWTMHLWFLLELFVYCLILAGLALSPARRWATLILTKIAERQRARPVLGWLVLLSTASVAVVVGLFLWQSVGADRLFWGLLTHNLVLFAPAFVLGVALGTVPQALDRFGRLPLLMLGVIGATAVASVLLVEVALEAHSPLLDAVHAASWTVGGLTLSALAFRGARRLFGVSRKVVRWLVDASLPIYLIHQPLVLLVALTCIDAGVTGWAGWTVTVAATLLGSVVFYEVANRFAWSRVLTTGSARRGSSAISLIGGASRGPRGSVAE